MIRCLFYPDSTESLFVCTSCRASIPTHIHASYGEDVAAIDIQTCNIIEGALPRKAMELVVEWMMIHQKDLMEIWETQNFKKLPPLE